MISIVGTPIATSTALAITAEGIQNGTPQTINQIGNSSLPQGTIVNFNPNTTGGGTNENTGVFNGGFSGQGSGGVDPTSNGGLGGFQNAGGSGGSGAGGAGRCRPGPAFARR